MRLTPVITPDSILLKIAYFLSKRMFGKVIAPLKVIYSRSTPIFFFAARILTTERKLKVDADTKLLVRNFVSHLNDCKFCANINEFAAQKNNTAFEKVKELMTFRQNNRFSAKEKALFTYLEEVTLTKTATDESFNELKTYFNDKEIIEITWLCATENYFNMMAKPLGLSSDELTKKTIA